MDYFEVIGISRDAEPAEVERRIREELRVWQRRTNSADLNRRQEAEQRVQQLTDAREALHRGGPQALAEEAASSAPAAEPEAQPAGEPADTPVPEPSGRRPVRDRAPVARQAPLGSKPAKRADHINFYLVAILGLFLLLLLYSLTTLR